MTLALHYGGTHAKVDSRALVLPRFCGSLRRGLAHYRLGKSLRPRLDNPQNHRQILPPASRLDFVLHS